MVIANQFSEMEELAVVLGAWESSSDPKVNVRHVNWLELEFLTDMYRIMFGIAEGTEGLLEMARMAYRAVRILTCSPTAPDAEEAGLNVLMDKCAEFVRFHPDHSARENVIGLNIAVELVLAKPSPVQLEVIGEISKFGTELEPPWAGQPTAVLVVPTDLVAPTESFLIEEDLEAHVRTPEQAKKHRYRGAIICGNLGTAYKSHWIRRERAAKTYGWLVTAPPAREVVLIEASVSTNRIADLWLLGPEARPPLSVDVTDPHTNLLVEH